MASALVLATLDTSHFAFEALGRTREECEQLLKDAWEVHTRDYPQAEIGYMRRLIDDGDVNFSTITVGGVLRDGETLL
jgi:hypothetical protein